MTPNTEKIKEKLDIVDVISSYIKVDRAGINYKARCPFHNEKTPSFFISPERQTFYCFGCGAKGDIFSFVEQFEGLDFKGALEILANKAGVELKSLRSSLEYQKSKDKKEVLFEIMEEATKFYQNALKVNGDAQDYLKKRGVSKNSIEKWRIGFAVNEWRNLSDALLKKGYAKTDMLKAGLLKKVDGQEKYYDTFRSRVMFPISDSAGRVVAFSGRLFGQETREGAPKYLNSPETDLFKKSEVLYGLHLAKGGIRKMDYTVLVEGQMDLVMAHQAGSTNTVASSGTALSVNHLQKIGRLSNRVIFALDPDEAGFSATKRVAGLALPLEMETKVAILEKGEDPASIIKKDPEIWKDSLKKSKHFTDFILEKISAEKEGERLTREIIKTVLPLVPLIKSEIEKSRFIKKIALKTGVTEEAVRQDVNKLKIINPIHEESGTTRTDIMADNESLIFEAEKHGYKIDPQKMDEEMARRKKVLSLKSDLQKAASMLDEKNLTSKREKEIKIKIGEIQKKIRELESKSY